MIGLFAGIIQIDASSEVGWLKRRRALDYSEASRLFYVMSV